MRHRNNSGKAQLTLVNAVILAVVIAIGGGVGVPLIEKSSARARRTAMLQSLHMLRTQIELYKAQHNGNPPVLFRNTFPQLVRATNAAGIPGHPGDDYPHGPYLRTGIPVNPITNRSMVTLTEDFPPTEASGNGGWIYHQQSGRIAVGRTEFIEE